jgi:hypothetical protein
VSCHCALSATVVCRQLGAGSHAKESSQDKAADDEARQPQHRRRLRRAQGCRGSARMHSNAISTRKVRLLCNGSSPGLGARSTTWSGIPLSAGVACRARPRIPRPAAAQCLYESRRDSEAQQRANVGCSTGLRSQRRPRPDSRSRTEGRGGGKAAL